VTPENLREWWILWHEEKDRLDAALYRCTPNHLPALEDLLLRFTEAIDQFEEESELG
jgi:hypothetical protein